MKLTGISLSAASGLLVAAALMGTAQAQEVTFYCDDLGFGCVTMAAAADRFEAENPGVTINLKTVAYQALVESLPVQLESGEGPDGAIITDLGGLSRYYLDLTPYVDVASFENEYGQTLQWLRGNDPQGKAINGMPT